jgi:uncharacterized protein involved in cysteine biosynthesis
MFAPWPHACRSGGEVIAPRPRVCQTTGMVIAPPPPPVPRPLKVLPTARLLQLAVGMSYPIRAFFFMRQHRLWRLAFLPIVVHVALMAALAVFMWLRLWPALQQLQSLVHSYVSVGSDYSDSVATVLSVVGFLVWLVLLPIVLGVAATLVLWFGHTLCAPWLDILAERVENQVLGSLPKPMSLRRLVDSIFLGLGDAVWGLFYLVLIYIPTLLTALLPGLGGLATLACGGLLLSQQFFGPTLGRAWLGYRARWQLVLDNRWFCMGYGAVAMLMVSVPGINLLLLPVTTVAGTLLCCDLIRAGRTSLPVPENLPVPVTAKG